MIIFIDNNTGQEVHRMDEWEFWSNYHEAFMDDIFELMGVKVTQEMTQKTGLNSRE